MLLQVDSRLRKTDHLVQRLLREARQIDDEVAAMAWQHMCIQISGNLEICIQDILTEFSRQRSNKAVAKVVERRLRGFMNPKFQKIKELLGEFDNSWGMHFEIFCNDMYIKDVIDSIVENRNRIAHGKPTQLSSAQIVEFNDAQRKAVMFIAAKAR